MYILVCRCSLISVCDNDFGITPVHDITIGNYYYNYYYYVVHHSTIDQIYLPLNLKLPLCLVFPHAVTVCTLRYVFLHPLDMFTFVTFITFKFTQIRPYNLFL